MVILITSHVTYYFGCPNFWSSTIEAALVNPVDQLKHE